MKAAISGPISSSERLDVVDVLRGLAVLGILIGNMQWFSGYGMMPESLQSANFSDLDKSVQFLVHFFVEGKFYSIFSFLFGFGFALQIARAQERGDSKARVFKRRLFWLFVIGILHAALLWAGDILSVYAVTGLVLLLFRKKSDRSLIKWAIGLIIFPILTYAVLLAIFAAYVTPAAVAEFHAGEIEHWADSVRSVVNGSWWDITREYNVDYLAGRWAGLVIQMRFPKILAMFLLGVWTYRKGILHEPAKHIELIKKVFVYGLLLGMIGNVLLAAFAGNEAPFPPTTLAFVGVVGYAFGVPALALAIAAGVTLLWQGSVRAILNPIRAVGRMALSNYLLQTVTCVTIFYGYGLAKFGTFSPTKATLMAFAIFAAQVGVSNFWLRSFQYGPMEWIWRQLTYRRRIPITREPAAV